MSDKCHRFLDDFEPATPDTFEGPNTDTRERMQECARTLMVLLPPDTGFILFAFDLGDRPNNSIEYVSNGDREGCLKLMQGWIDQQKVRPGGTTDISGD